MEVIYPFALVVHLFCAILFVGYLLAEAIFLVPLFKQIPSQWSEKIKEILGRIETRVMPPSFLILILSGGMMVSQYLGGENGYFQNLGQILLGIKVILALCILCLVVFSLSMFFIFKKPNPLRRYMHPIVLCLALAIVLLAKLMFWV